MNINERMKENYEGPAKHRLIKRTPVIIRLDGKAFHTFTKNFIKPFDPIFIEAMQKTTLELCKNIQGAMFGYTQSDEISIFLQDYENFETSAWFDYEVQKLCSVSASMATLYFNKFLSEAVTRFTPTFGPFEGTYADEQLNKELEAYKEAVKTGALFDARCFNIPKEEVVNYFYSRQLDAIRNSVQMVGQHHFSQKALHKKSQEDIKEMLLNVGDDWENYRTCEKHGTACFKEDGWKIDMLTPVFKDNREYIERFV